MKLTFLGAAHEVTGSCTLLEACGKRILIDCGLEQGPDTYENCQLPVAAGQIDAVLLTHAHMDHSGKLPALVAQGYGGPIYATEATRRLCVIMLKDSAHIQAFEAEWRNRKARRAGQEAYQPLYSMEDALATLELFHPCTYGQMLEICPGITAEFLDAGHLLGSSSIFLHIREEDEERTLLFSGDLGNRDRPLIRNPQKPPRADYVVIESTYGDRLHGERPDYVGQLAQILDETFAQGGNVVIPSFAVGRTQELLYLLRIIKERGLLARYGNFPVYVDSPLAVEATRIYSDGMTDYYDQETLNLLAQGIDPISLPGLRLSLTAADSKAINEVREPKVILSASGMCEAGRIRHHLKHNLWRSNATILFVGYQAEGTLGRKLIDGATSVRLFGEDIAVNARIATMAGISGHADRDMLLDWLGDMEPAPRRVFVNHGNDERCDLFAAAVTEKLGYRATAPYSGDAFELLHNECVEQGRIVKVTKQSDGRRRANAIFEKLLAAEKRLLYIIQQSRGLSNKELSRLTDQINALCDKYAKK